MQIQYKGEVKEKQSVFLCCSGFLVLKTGFEMHWSSWRSRWDQPQCDFSRPLWGGWDNNGNRDIDRNPVGTRHSPEPNEQWRPDQMWRLVSSWCEWQQADLRKQMRNIAVSCEHQKTSMETLLSAAVWTVWAHIPISGRGRNKEVGDGGMVRMKGSLYTELDLHGFLFHFLSSQTIWKKVFIILQMRTVTTLIHTCAPSRQCQKGQFS